MESELMQVLEDDITALLQQAYENLDVAGKQLRDGPANLGTMRHQIATARGCVHSAISEWNFMTSGMHGATFDERQKMQRLLDRMQERQAASDDQT